MKLSIFFLTRLALSVALCLGLIVALSGCQSLTGRSSPTSVPATVAPAAPAAKVTWNGSYATNVQPIFNQRCVGCHGPSRAENQLRLDSYEGVMKGTQFGPVVVPGEPNQSALVSVVRGSTDPSIRMPHGGAGLNNQDVLNITEWVQAGAPKN